MINANIDPIAPAVAAVFFDFDGTLTRPGALDFAQIRQALGCPPDTPILEFIESKASQKERAYLTEQLDAMEMRGAVISAPNSNAESLIHFLRGKTIQLGIITRNGLKQVKRAFRNFKTIDMQDFDIIITRDTPVPPKPDPRGILRACSRLQIQPAEVIMVGDYLYDIQAGKAAGTRTVFLRNPGVAPSFSVDSDYVVTNLHQIKILLESESKTNE